MRIAFDTQSLRQLCEQEENANDALGAEEARKLMNRLADLSAAHTVHELVAGRPHPVDGADEYAVNLGDTSRIIFCANHVTNPVLGNGAIDWSRVRRIRVLRIEGRHA